MLTTMLLLIISGCVKDSKHYTGKIEQENIFDLKPYEKVLLEKEKKETEGDLPAPIPKPTKTGYELDFTVQNNTGKTMYLSCFSYIKKVHFTRWRWDKSPVYTLKPNESVIINIDTIPDKKWRKNVFGSLALFENKQDAEDSTYELLDDSRRIDLDKLYKLHKHNEKVILEVEKYGIKGNIFDCNIVPKDHEVTTYGELDFVIENKTGKTIYTTCFIYQIKDDEAVWKYDKTNIKKLEPGEQAVIDVDTIVESYNRVYATATLGIFDEYEKKAAEESTYQLLASKNKLEIGRLAEIKNKKIVLEVEQYGFTGDFIEFSFKPDTQKQLKKVTI
jgi:hypothetical protein